MKVAVYLRMSTSQQEDSFDRQRGTVYPAIKAHPDWVVHGEYADEAMRGYDDSRPGFQSLMADALNGKFQAIVVDEVSRLSRSEMLPFLARVAYPLWEAGVQLYAVQEGGFRDWDQCVGVILSALDSDKSSGESKKIGWRVAGQLRKRFAEGSIRLGTAPYGYVKDKTADGRTTLVPDPNDPQRPDTVRFIFDAYVNRDMSFHDIAADLERRCVPSPRGLKYWTRQAVSRILADHNYAGFYVHGRYKAGKFFELNPGVPEGVSKAPPPKAKRPGGRVPKVRWEKRAEPLSLIPNQHEPLVSIELFEAAQAARVANTGRSTPLPQRGDYLFSGLLVCGGCKGRMHGFRPGGKKNPTPYYRCDVGANSGGRCFTNMVPQRTVLDKVVKTLVSAFDTPTFRQDILDRAAEAERRAAGPDNVGRLRGEQKTLEEDISRTVGRMCKVKDDATFDEMNSQVTSWRKRLADVKRELAATGPTECAETSRVLSETGRLVGQLNTSISSFRDDDPDSVIAVRQLMKAVLARVEITVHRQPIGNGKKSRYTMTGGLVTLRSGRLPAVKMDS